MTISTGLRLGRRQVLGMTAVTAAALATGACSDQTDSAETVELQWGMTSDISEPIYVAAEEAAAAIEERSEGRLHIDLFPNEQLGTLPEMHEQAAAGAPLLFDTNAGFAAEYGSPGLGILQGPYLFDSYEQISTFTDSDLMAEWAQELGDGGLHSFKWNWYYGQRHLIGDAGYESPQDLAGKLVRVSGNPVQAAIFEALGATPVELGRSEIYSALSQGVAQASDGPIPQLLGDSLHEVADHVTMSGHVDMVVGILMSSEVFNGLASDLQAILTEEIDKAGERFTELQGVAIEEDRQELEGLGVTFHDDVDRAAYQQASESFYDGSANPAWTLELRQRVLDAAGS